MSGASVFSLATGLLWLASEPATAATITATAPADITTAINSANGGGAPVVVTPSGTPVDLTGVTLPTLTSGVLTFGDGVQNLGLITAGSITDDASVVFDLPRGQVQTIDTSISGTGSLTLTTGSTQIAAYDFASVYDTATISGTNTYSGGTTINDVGSAPLIAEFMTPGSVPSAGSITLDSAGLPYGGAVAAFGFAFNQTDLNLIATGSVGAVALGADNSNALDFTNYAGLSLTAATTYGGPGAVYTYSGAWTPYSGGGTPTYLVGGGDAVLMITSNLGDAGAATRLLGGSTGATILNPTTANTYTGGTEIDWGFLEFASAAALPAEVGGATNLQIGHYGVAAFGLGDGVYNLTQAALNQIQSSSAGTAALTADSAAALDFTNIPNVSLGAVNGLTTTTFTPITYTGTLTPGANGYMIGGGNEPLIVDTLLSGAAGLSINESQHNAITVILTYADTYTGSTMIDGGSLQLGSGTTAGTISAASTVTLNGASLRFDEPNPITFSNLVQAQTLGVLFNDGDLIQDGPGTVTLTQAEHYAGFTEIDQGTLALGAGGSITDSRFLLFQPDVSTTLTFDISGASGPVTIQSVYANAGAPTQNVINLGANSLTIEPSAYIFDTPQSSGIPAQFYGVIQGSGGLTLAENTIASNPNSHGLAVNLLLVGDNTYTGGTTIGANATLQLGDGTYSGTLGTGAVSNAGAIVFEEGGAETVANAIGGAGTVTQQGPGAVTLDAANTYTGLTEVASGLLDIGDASHTAASVGGNVQVDSAGVLGGYGTIGGNLVNNGLVQPNSLSVTGTYTQATSGYLLVGVTPSSIDLLTIGGAASLAGTVTFAYAPGTYTAQTYTFLKSSGLGGTSFATVAASVSNPVPTGFSQSVTYTSDDAILNLTGSSPTPTPPPPTPTPPPPTPTPPPPTPTPPPPTPTPPPPTPTPTPVVVAPADSAIFSAQTFAVSQANQDAVAELLARAKPDGGGDTFFNLIPVTGDAARAWAEVDAATTTAGANGSNPGFHTDTSGLQGGGDLDVGAGNRVGLALGYDRDTLHDKDQGSASGDIFRASLYASQPLGGFGLSEVISYAKAWNATNRATGVGMARASFTSDDLTGAIQVSAPFKAGGFDISPAAGALVSRLTASAFSETDLVSAAFAVKGQGQSASFATPYVSVGISQSFMNGAIAITPDAEIGYRYDQAAQGQRFTLTAADSTVFTGNRVGLSGGSAVLGLSLTAHQGAWSAYAKYRAQVASGWSDQSGAVGFRVAF